MKRIISLVLLCGLLLGLFSGCAQSEEAYVPTGDGLTWEEEDAESSKQDGEKEEPQHLGLSYNANASFNPYTCTDYTNRALFSLLFQSLFVTDRNYESHPILCSRYVMSRDMKTYTFYIDENATFSDGTKLTIKDVEASLKAAEDSRIYGGRFSKILRMYISEDNGITMELSTAYENLPILLDIPIIKATQLDFQTPLGTGPYQLSRTDSGMQLMRRTNWWCTSDLVVTAPYIQLTEYESPTQIRDEFQFGELDLVVADPGSDNYADFRCDFELWDSENGIFLFLAVNHESDVFASDLVRKALTHSIDRELIVDDFYRGFARAASLPVSPQSPYYNSGLASRYSYQPDVFENAVKEASRVNWEMILVCNGDDSLRMRVADLIAENLRSAGLIVDLRYLTGRDYTNALVNGEYDLYLGQTKLSPNMDLSPFFSTVGALNYGGMSSLEMHTLCQQALENSGNYYTLHLNVMENAYLCPILFRSYSVFATRGLLTGLTPSRDQIFYYTIGKSMENVRFVQAQTVEEE